MAPHESDGFFDWAYTQALFNKSVIYVGDTHSPDWRLLGGDGEAMIRVTNPLSSAGENIHHGEYEYDFLEFSLNDIDYDVRNETKISGWQLTWSHRTTEVHSLRLTEEQQALVEDLFRSIKKERDEDASS